MKKQFTLIAALLILGSIAVIGQTADPTVSNSRPSALGVANLTFYQKMYAVANASGMATAGTAGGIVQYGSANTSPALVLDVNQIAVASDFISAYQYDISGYYSTSPDATGVNNGASVGRTALFLYDDLGIGFPAKSATTVTISDNVLNNGNGVAYPDTYIGATSDAPAGRRYVFNANNLTVNKLNGTTSTGTSVPNKNIFVANSDIEVNGIATFTSGLLFLGNNDLFTVVTPSLTTGDNGAGSYGSAVQGISGGSVNSYVDGNIRNLTKNASFKYPLGDQGIYSPTTIVGFNATAPSTTLRYYVNANGHASPTGVVPSPSDYLVTISPDEYYQVTSNLPAGSTITIPLNAFSAYSTLNSASTKLTIAGWNGSKWVNLKGSGGVAPSASTVTVTTAQSLSGIQYYALGLGSDFVLPITWLNFTAKPSGTDALINWQVADAAFAVNYQVQRSADGKNFTTLATVPASFATTYSYTDAQPLDGLSYYRIKGAEKDGTFTYTSIAPVRFGNAAGNVKLYPNPIETNASLLIDKGNLGQTTIGVYNAAGSLLQQTSINVTGATMYQLNMANYPSGFYTLKISTATDNVANMKVIKK